MVVDELPRSSGGKVAKGDLKEDAKRRAGGVGCVRGERRWLSAWPGGAPW